MRVTNHTDAALGIEGISIPAGQSRNVKGLDPEKEKVKARLEAGDISIAGYSEPKPMYVQTEPELPDNAKAEDYIEEDGPIRKRLFGKYSES